MKSLINNQEIQNIISISKDDANIQFETKDIEEVFKSKSSFQIIVDEANSKNSIQICMDKIVQSIQSIKNISTLLIRFDMNPNYPAKELMLSIQFLNNLLDKNSGIIFGTSTNEALSKQYIKISAIVIYGT